MAGISPAPLRYWLFIFKWIVLQLKFYFPSIFIIIYLFLGVHSRKKRLTTDVRDEVHAEKSLHWKGCLKECIKRNGNINNAWTSILGEPMVFFSRYIIVNYFVNFILFIKTLDLDFKIKKILKNKRTYIFQYQMYIKLLNKTLLKTRFI